MRHKLKQLLIGYSAYSWGVRRWMDLSSIELLVSSLIIPEFMETIPATPPAGNVYVVAPHADDVLFGCGGTLMLSGARIQVTMLAGEPETRKEVSRIAQGHEWSIVPLQHDLSGIDHLFCPWILDGHRTHRASLRHLMDMTGNPMVWAYQVYSVCPPNVYVDVTRVIPDLTLDIRSLRSQNGHRNWVHWHLGMLAFNSRWLPSGVTDSRYLEVFFRVPLEEYKEWIGRAMRR